MRRPRPTRGLSRQEEKKRKNMRSLITICGTEAWVKTDTTTAIKIKK